MSNDYIENKYPVVTSAESLIHKKQNLFRGENMAKNPMKIYSLYLKLLNKLDSFIENPITKRTYESFFASILGTTVYDLSTKSSNEKENDYRKNNAIINLKSIKKSLTILDRRIDLVKKGSNIAAFSSGLRDISKTTLSMDQTAKVAEIGSTKFKTPKGLLTYTKATANLAAAFDMCGEKAANTTKAIAVNFDQNPKGLETYSDSLYNLAANSGVSGEKILAATKNIKGSGAGFKISAQGASALAASLIKMGKTPEEASASVNKLLTRLGDRANNNKSFQIKLGELGIDVTGFQQTLKTDPNKAISNVVGKINKLDKKQRNHYRTQLFGRGFGFNSAKMLEFESLHSKNTAAANDKSAKGKLAAFNEKVAAGKNEFVSGGNGAILTAINNFHNDFLAFATKFQPSYKANAQSAGIVKGSLPANGKNVLKKKQKSNGANTEQRSADKKAPQSPAFSKGSTFSFEERPLLKRSAVNDIASKDVDEKKATSTDEAISQIAGTTGGAAFVTLEKNTAKILGKQLGKLTPGLALGITGYAAYERLQEGDTVGALIEIGTGVAATIGGPLGILAAALGQTYLVSQDIEKEMLKKGIKPQKASIDDVTHMNEDYSSDNKGGVAFWKRVGDFFSLNPNDWYRSDSQAWNKKSKKNNDTISSGSITNSFPSNSSTPNNVTLNYSPTINAPGGDEGIIRSALEKDRSEFTRFIEQGIENYFARQTRMGMGNA